jgi:hypothetical protein
MRRIAKPGGRLICSISFHPSITKVDGEGVHPTVKPPEWWIDQINRVAAPVRRVDNAYLTGVFG